MNKKLFGTLLLGSLLMGGTFVSCKDYDDDIKNLQEQISNLATKSDVETKLGQLQSALTAAQQKAEEALAAAKAADNSAEVKALSEKLDKIADAQAAVNDALEATKNEVSEQLAEFDEATKQMIAEAQMKAEETVGKVADYVTAVKLVVLPTQNLKFESSKIKQSNEKEFGKADTYAKDKAQSASSTYAYKAGDYVKSPTSIILRVDPSNAQLTANDIKLLDSKGNDLSGVVEIDNVFPYDQLLTRGGNGLWQVNLKAADGITSGKLANATTTDVNGVSKQKLYAVAVNNTMSTAEERYVMSDYEVTFEKTNGITTYAGVTNLDGVKISTTQNKGTFDATNSLDVPKIYAANGEKITVAFPAGSNADRFYVVRADDQASQAGGNNSANAWKRYSYTGLGEIKSITDGEKLEMSITIDEDLAVGDDICFRLYAVNRDGSYVLNLTDDDGNANKKHGMEFWVHVGKNQNNASAIVANITAQSSTEFSTGWVEYNGTLVDGAELPTTATLKLGNSEFSATIAYAKSISNGVTNATKNSEIKYVKVTLPYDNAKDIKDNATLVGTIETKNNNVKENVIEVSLTKTLPSVEQTKKLMNYSWKAGQLVNGVYTAYLYPTGDVWTTGAASGYKTMTQAINGLVAPAFIAIDNAALTDPDSNGKKYYTATNKVTSPFKLTVNNDPDAANVKLIDNTTQHKTVIGYNYGKFSTETLDDQGNPADYTVVVEEYKTVFACPLVATVQTLAWKKYEAPATQTLTAVSKDLNVITYNTGWSSLAQDNITPLKLADFLIATNAFDNVVFGGKFSKVFTEKYVQPIEAKLVSNETGNEDYFEVTYDTSAGDFKFTAKSGTTNPAIDVPSTLKITLKDCFGHKNEYSLPFTVKRAQ